MVILPRAGGAVGKQCALSVKKPEAGKAKIGVLADYFRNEGVVPCQLQRI